MLNFNPKFNPKSNPQIQKVMKTKSTIQILVALTIVLGFAFNSFAQQSANDNILGKADVVAAVTVDGAQDLQFGNVTPGNTKTISTTGSVAAGTAGGTTETQGKYNITKGANSQVTLAFTLPTNLTDGGSNNLAINFNDYNSTKCGLITGSGSDVPFTPATGITTANAGATAWVFGESAFTVNLGGTVVPTVGQAAGAYTGTITLTATYN